MSHELDSLPPDVQAMLLAEKRRVSAPRSARSRLAERLSVAVPAFGAPHVVPSAAPPAPHLVATGTALKAGIVKVALVLAVGGGAVVGIRESDHVLGRATHAAPARTTQTIAPAKVARPIVPPAVASEEAVSVVVTPAAPPAIAPPVAPSARTSSLSPQAGLREERRLLDLAQDAVSRGDPQEALLLTAMHADRFPRGELGPQSELLRIRALARLGRKAEARAALAAMRESYPQSFLLEGAALEVDAIP